jgi:hypothetical protein
MIIVIGICIDGFKEAHWVRTSLGVGGWMPNISELD